MGLLVALFSLAAMVWVIPILRSGRMLPLVTLVLLTGTVLGPSFFAIDGPFQLSLDRMLWVGVVGVCLIRWRMGDFQIPKPSRTDFVVIGIAVWLLLSCLRGGPVPDGSSPIARWFFFVAMPVSMYAMARCIRIADQDLRWLFRALLALSLYLAVTALFELLGLRSLVFPRFISDPTIWEFYGRARGPLLNPAGNGILLTVGLVITTLGFLQGSLRAKVIYATLSLLIVAGLYATLTRSVWVGAIASLAVISLIYAPRWVRVQGMMTAIFFAAVMAGGLQSQLVAMKRDKNLSAADAAKSVELRPLLAVVAFEMFQDRPIIGHGYGHYVEQSPPYHTDRSWELPLEQARPYIQHNVLLSILVDTGMVGLLGFASLFVMLASIGWTLARNEQLPSFGWGHQSPQRDLGMVLLGLLAAYLVNGLFHEVSIIEMMHMFVFFIAGVAVTVYREGTFAQTVAKSAPNPQLRASLERRGSFA